MAHLRQDQRKTIESLFDGRSVLPSGLHTYEQFELQQEKSPLYFLGMSEGYGTCSNVFGVDVAVFGFEPFEQQTPLRPFSHAVALRPAGVEELTEYQRQFGMLVGVVERLDLESVNCSRVSFRLTGHKGSYVIRSM